MILPGLDALFSITFCSNGTMELRFIAHIYALLRMSYGSYLWPLASVPRTQKTGMLLNQFRTFKGAVRRRIRSAFVHLTNHSLAFVVRLQKQTSVKRQSYQDSSVLFTFNFFLMISFQNTFLQTSPFLSG